VSGLATRGEEPTLCLVTSASDYWNRVAETKTFRHPLERRRTTEDPRERA